MNVGQTAIRQAIDEVAIVFHPAFVEQIAELSAADGLDGYVAALFRFRVINRHAHGLPCLSVEHPVVVLARLDFVSVDFLDDATGGDARFLHGEWTALDDFLNAQTIALVVLIEEEAELSRRKSRRSRTITRSRVRSVQFTEQFAEQVAEVVVVADVGQEFLVGGTIVFPIDTVQIRLVEFVLHLPPNVVEKIATLLVRLEVERRFESDDFRLVFAQIDLFDGVRADEKVLESLIGLHSRTAHIFQHEFGLVFEEIALPKVESALKRSLIIERVALRREDGVAHVTRRGGEAHDAVAAVVEVELERSHFRLFGLFGILSSRFLALVLFVFLVFVSIVGGLFLLFFRLVQKYLFLLRHTETVVGFEVEEHQIGIVFRTPTAVRAIACAVALVEHRLTAERPFSASVAVGAVRQVVDFATSRGIDDGNVSAVPTAFSDVARHQPTAVGTPLKPQVAVAVGIVEFAVHRRVNLLCGKVHHAQRTTVFKKGNHLSVGAVFRLLRGQIGLREAFLLEFRRVSKEFFVLVFDARAENLPHAVALGGINDAATVGRETDIALLFGRVGDALRGFIVDGSHIDIAVGDKGDFLARRRKTDFRRAVCQRLAHKVAVAAVGHDAHAHFLRTATLAERVDFAVVAVAERAVFRRREEAHGIALVMGQLRAALLPNIKGAVLLAQVVERASVGCPNGRAIFASEVGEFRVATVFQQPNIACHGTLMMLAEYVLIAFHIVVEDVAVGIDADVFHRDD